MMATLPLQSLVLMIMPKAPNSRSLGLAIINSTTVIDFFHLTQFVSEGRYKINNFK